MLEPSLQYIDYTHKFPKTLRPEPKAMETNDTGVRMLLWPSRQKQNELHCVYNLADTERNITYPI